MKNMIKSMLMKLLDIESIKKEAYKIGYDEGCQKWQNIFDVEKELELEKKLAFGNWVISISNEWNELVVGQVIKLEEHNIPVVKDYISGQEMYCMGVTIPYSDEILLALAKLNPFERYSLVIAFKSYSADNYIFDKKKTYGDEKEVELKSYDFFEELIVKIKKQKEIVLFGINKC